MGNKCTITNHKPYVICNQTTHNTRNIKSERNQVLLHKIDYKWMKIQCRRLSSSTEPRIAENPLKEKL